MSTIPQSSSTFVLGDPVSEQPVSDETVALLPTSAAFGELTSRMIEGRTLVLQQSAMLLRFAERCGQAGAMQDLAYFLSKPGLLRRTPQLMLISAASEGTGEDTLLGAVLFYDYRVLGRRLGMYTTNDRSGRNTLVAPAHLRSSLAEFAVRSLVERGAHVVMISYRDGDDIEPSEAGQTTGSWKKSARLARRERVIPAYLPLAETYDATLAQIGKRTRGHIRYYRKRAETLLGCSFCPAVEVSRTEFLKFNRDCSFAVPERVAAWRFDVHRELSSPIFAGMRDSDGQWLSMIGARRFNTSSEILWQMNREGFPSHSLSLVMRSYFIEQELQHGSRRFYLEGGSSHPIQHSFVQERLTDLAVLRQSTTALLTRRMVRHIVPGDNHLAHMLNDPDLTWMKTRGWSTFRRVRR